ncbi:MAG: S-layer homology domain-containing protein [Clostridia bacterium]|nr:S-layer homology domain-containing protein [Clostridia bacterium]
MKKLLAVFLASILFIPAGSGLAEENKDLTYPIKIAPTVELRENGQAYSIKERPIKSADYKVSYYEMPTKVADENGDVEHMVNGGFESAAGSKLVGWSSGGIEGGVLGESGAFIVNDTVEGEKAIRLTAPEGKNIHAVQTFTNLVPGEEYELSAWCKRTAGTATISLGFRYTDPDTRMDMEYSNRVNLSFKDTTPGAWTQMTVKFVTPEDIVGATMLLRLMNGGEMIYDNVSLLGPTVGVKKIEMPEYTKPGPDTENLFKNASFEDATEVTHIAHGQEYEGVWFDRDDDVMKGWFSYTDEDAHTGKQCLKIDAEIPPAPWIGQMVKVEPETTYQVSVWIKLLPDSDYTFKFQGDCYRNGTKQTAENYVGDGRTSLHVSVDPENYDWQQLVATFTTHQDADYYCMMLRHGDGETYRFLYDDVEMYPLSGLSKKMRSFIPDDVFYYSDYEGTGYADLTTYKTVIKDDEKVRFRFYDGEKVILEEIVSLLEDGTQRFTYPLELLAEKKKEYKLEAVMLDANGQPTDDKMERYIYKYDRPTMLDESMELLTAAGDKVENYILAQGTLPEVMWRIPEVGATIGRGIGTVRTDRIERLDVAQQAGMYATITLYNHEDIRDPEVRQHVIDTINQVKDHPALIGWYLWEEPKFREDTYDLQENLRIGAKIIRDMDPKHPIFGVVSNRYHAQELGKFCDIIDMDIYPAQIYTGQRGENIAHAVAIGLESNDWQKHISIMNQAFEWFEYKPTWPELRNFIYSAMFEGASGFSFHTFGTKDSKAENGTCVKLDDEIWKQMEVAAKWEYDFIFDHFTLMKNPLFNEGRTEDVRWRTLVRDGVLYAIVINTWETKECAVDIPLTDFTGKITVNGATAELVEGGSPKSIDIEGDTFHVDLEKFQAAVYKITPKTQMDFSSVKPSRFRDLSQHTWAREAIIELDEKGICNDLSAIAYAPGRNITRGDFAMFLVRTLGLTGDGSTVSFDDVSPKREYAKEIAIGKATGILNGVGDNKFNPDAAISRQDMMTIISRGMKLSGETNLSEYADGGSVSDYALPHVKAMIASGLVKGNADGTINPLGNTTRAETAVIMQRILKK